MVCLNQHPFSKMPYKRSICLLGYRISDRLVEKHHLQVFDEVLSSQLGSTRPVVPLDNTERQQLQRLVVKHAEAGHLKKGGNDLSEKIQERTKTAPPAVKVLLWIFTPPPASEPWWKVRAARVAMVL